MVYLVFKEFLTERLEIRCQHTWKDLDSSARDISKTLKRRRAWYYKSCARGRHFRPVFKTVIPGIKGTNHGIFGKNTI